MQRLPDWIRTPLTTDVDFSSVTQVLSHNKLETVCNSAKCPNKYECWNSGTATFMILGNICTRNCGFCAVPNGHTVPVDESEPARIVNATRKLKLKHVVITSVTRDDLADGGASVFAETISLLKTASCDIMVEVLTPDFQGKTDSLNTVLFAGPDVFNHNLETVKRLQPFVRPQANYERSLAVLQWAADNYPAITIKSGLMVGLGETNAEVFKAMRDLYNVGCRTLTVGQYLAPTANHFSVKRFVPPDEFVEFEKTAYKIGFTAVASGPLVRSSYEANKLHFIKTSKAESAIP